MEKLWQIRCFEGLEEKWTKRIRLSDQDMIGLLRLLLCQNLEHYEIIESVLGQRDLLEVRQEGCRMSTLDGLLRYVAQEEAE